MRTMFEDHAGDAGICQVWGAKPKGATPTASDPPDGHGGHVADLFARRTPGRRIGAGDFVIPAQNRYAPVVAGFSAKATGPHPGARPRARCGCEGSVPPKASGKRGCGCGGNE